MPTNRAAINALLRQMEGPIASAFAHAIATAKGRVQLERIITAIEHGNIDKVMESIGFRESMYSGLSEEIRAAYAQGGAFTLAKNVPAKYNMDFDISNPRAESWLRFNSSKLITGDLLVGQRTAIRVMLENGMEFGKNPRSVALDIVGRISKETGRRAGGVIGLNAPQAEWLKNMRNTLEHNPRAYFIEDQITGKMKPRFTLSDRRFDKTVEKAIRTKTPIPEATRNQIAGNYENRLLKLRGDTIGRTEALRALNESADEALRQVVDDGLAPADSIIRIWRHSFSQNEREGHLMMDGQEAKLGEYFHNPLTGAALQYPGDGGPEESINCRCWVEQQIDFVAVEQAKEGTKAKPVQPKPTTAKPTAVKPTAAKPIAPIAAMPPPAPKPVVAPNAPPIPKPATLNGIGAPVVRQEWMSEWVKVGTFDTKRLSRLYTKLDDPGQLHEGGGAFHRTGSLNMDSYPAPNPLNQSVMRHEWGHYLDFELGKRIKDSSAFLHEKLLNLLGSSNLSKKGYASGWTKAQAALNSDKKYLEKLGSKIYKKVFPLKKDRLISSGRLDWAWEERSKSLWAAQDPEKINAARKVLQESDSLVAKVWRRLEDDVSLSDNHALMFADAVKTGDASVLLSGRGMWLRAIRFSEAGNDGVFSALSDYLGAITQENIAGYDAWGFGHGKGYYFDKKLPSSLRVSAARHYQGTEAFANITSMEKMRRTDPLLDEILKTFAPKYTKWYDDLIDALNDAMQG